MLGGCDGDNLSYISIVQLRPSVGSRQWREREKERERERMTRGCDGQLIPI